MSCTGVTSMGSDATPITMSLPLGARPSIRGDMAFELGGVARMACAPPRHGRLDACGHHLPHHRHAEQSSAADHRPAEHLVATLVEEVGGGCVNVQPRPRLP